MNKLTVRDVDLAGKRVLVRVDFNVPIANGEVTDDTRIRESVATIRYILEQKPKAVILLSHLGRPKGERSADTSLAPAAPILANYLGVDVAFVTECTGEIAEQAIANLPEGGVILLENTRYHKGEEKNDAGHAEALAKHGDIFVNDAFGTAHRAHSSNVGISERIQPSVAGLLMEKEINYLSNAIENPQRPFVAILGGAKVSDKIAVIEALLSQADYVLIGGGMANTFFAAQGIPMGDSLVEKDAIETAKMLLAKGGDKLVLPVDAVVANAFSNDAERQTIAISAGTPDGWRVLDIGPETLQHFHAILTSAKTVVWNGPMGVFEMPNFAVGTFEVAKMLADITGTGAVTIIGGGDSAAAAEQSGLAGAMTHISTGGGASLEMLEGQVLPGLAALTDK